MNGRGDSHRKSGPGRKHLQGKSLNQGGTKWLAPMYRPRKARDVYGRKHK